MESRQKAGEIPANLARQVENKHLSLVNTCYNNRSRLRKNETIQFSFVDKRCVEEVAFMTICMVYSWLRFLKHSGGIVCHMEP